MEGVLVALAILACPVGMGLMMFFMAKGMRGGKHEEPRDLDRLRDEHRRLGEQIEHLEGRSAPETGYKPRARDQELEAPGRRQQARADDLARTAGG